MINQKQPMEEEWQFGNPSAYVAKLLKYFGKKEEDMREKCKGEKLAELVVKDGIVEE